VSVNLLSAACFLIPSKSERSSDLEEEKGSSETVEFHGIKIRIVEMLPYAKALLDTFLAWQEKNRNTILAAELRFRFRLDGRTVTGFIDRIEQQPDGGLVVIDFKTGSKPSNITKAGIRDDIQMNIYCMAVQERYGKLPARASLYYLKDDKAIDYIPDEESIAAFKERLQGMVAAVCAEEFVARPSYMGCRNCDYGDLCDAGEKGDRS
jgi:DNA helicase-2/ATP-dependent DNA helicase PcrA